LGGGALVGRCWL